MRVLIPLLAKNENNTDFLNAAVRGAEEVHLLLVVDTSGMLGEFGFAAGEISQGNALIEEIKQLLGKKYAVEEAVEWGGTAHKIENFAKLKAIDKIVFMRQKNKFFDDLVKGLKEMKMKVEVI